MGSKNFSRRDFIQKGTLASIAATAIVGNSLAQPTMMSTIDSEKSEKFNFPTSATKRLTKLLNIKYPIIQAPTAGAINSSFTAAVANNGALGALPLSWTAPEHAIKRINDIKQKTKNSFFANFVLNFEPKPFDIAVDNGVPIIQFSWGMPTKAMVSKMKAKKIVLGIQVTSEASAEMAIDLGADYLVCQGTEAGGHVHASMPLNEALEEVLAVAGNIPVVASGGITTGNDIYKYLSLGAAGVVMGSRFVCTKESIAHPKYKETLLNSSSKDTVFTVCLNKGWSNATHRIIRNKTFKIWEAAGCPVEGKRPNENEILATYKNNDVTVTRYQGNVPNINMGGKVEELGMYAGKGISHIKDIPTVAELIERIWKEFLNN